MSDDDNVIPFPFKKRGEGDLPARPVTKAKTPLLPFCSHHMFEIDEDHRAVTCSRCARSFDAFEALGLLARDWSQYDWSHRSARHEIVDLEKERESIKKQVSNLKAQRRKLVPNVRRAVQRAKANLFRAIHERVDHVRSALLREVGSELETVQQTIDSFGSEADDCDTEEKT